MAETWRLPALRRYSRTARRNLRKKERLWSAMSKTELQKLFLN